MYKPKMVSAALYKHALLILAILGIVTALIPAATADQAKGDNGESRVQLEANGTTITKMTDLELSGFLRDHEPDIQPDSGYEYDPDSAVGWYTENSGVYISYNLIGDEALRFGTVGTLFEQDGSQVQNEIIAVGNEEGGTGKTWTDHQLVAEDNFSESDADETLVPQANAFTRFSDCMDSKGVPGWVINAISIGCAAVCAATLGTGCVACIGGLAGAYSTNIGYCVAKASKGE